MAQPFIGEIRLFAGTYAPFGWSFCDGSLLSISNNPALFNLIGTTYGGDGINTFSLPDLRSRLPVHQSPNMATGSKGGSEQVTLNTTQIPLHNHNPLANSQTGTSSSPAGNYWASQPSLLPYGAATSINTTLNASSISFTGGNQPHDNMVPFLAVTYIIALYGAMPTFS